VGVLGAASHTAVCGPGASFSCGFEWHISALAAARLAAGGWWAKAG